MLHKSKQAFWQATQGKIASLSAGSSANLIYDPQRSSISQSSILINSITDLVGGTIQATASGAQRPSLAQSPIDGRNVIRFGGSMELNTASTNVDPRNFTMVFVTDLSNFAGGSGNGQGVLAGFGGGATRSIFYNNASVSAFDVSTLIGYGGTYNTGTFNIITVVGNATNVIARCNGVELFNSPAFSATPNFTNIRLGRAENLVQSLIGCDIAYFEVYNTALDATSRAANEDRIRALIPVKSLNTSIPRFYFLGNSLTEGRGNTARDKRWAELAMYSSNLSSTGRDNFLVRGYAGATTVQLTGAINPILTKYMGNGTNSYTFVWELSNDINISQNGTTAYDNLKTLCQNIKNDAPNTKIIVMTMLPRGAVAGVETARVVANGLVMASTTKVSGIDNFYTKGVDNIDFVFDVAGITTIGAPGAQSNTTYYQTDQIHLTDVGYALIGANSKEIINYCAQSYDVDYQAFLNQATSLGYTLPSIGQRVSGSRLISSLKSSSVWDKLDLFRVYATDGDQNVALLNWKNPAANQAVRVGTLTHTPNQGYNTDGTSYMDEMFNPFTAINFALNNAGKGAWIHTASNGGASNLTTIGGHLSASSQRWTNANSNGQRINASGSLDTAASQGGTGLRSIYRTTSNDVSLYSNTTPTARIQASTGQANENIISFRSGSDMDNGSMKLSIVFYGADLTAYNTDLYNALNTYMTGL